MDNSVECDMNDDLDLGDISQDRLLVLARSFIRQNKGHLPEDPESLLNVANSIAFLREVEKEKESFDPFYYPNQEYCRASCLGWNGESETCDCGRNALTWKAKQGTTFLDMLVDIELDLVEGYQEVKWQM